MALIRGCRLGWIATFAGALVGAVIASCSESPSAPPLRPALAGPAPSPAAATALALGALPVAVDDRGVPRLLHGGPVTTSVTAVTPAADAATAARRHAERLAPAWGVPAGAMPQLVSAGEIAVPGGTIVRLRQVVAGVPIAASAGGELRVMVDPGGALIAIGGAARAAHVPAPPALAAGLDEAGAIAHAVGELYGSRFDAGQLAIQPAVQGGAQLLAGTSAGITISLARAQRAWYPDAGALVLAWVVEAYSSDATTTTTTTSDAYRTVIAADDGRTLERTDLTADAQFSYRAFAQTTGELHPFDGALDDASPHRTGVPHTVVLPGPAAPNLVTVDGLNHPGGPGAPPDPWLIAGRMATVGNNVDAYTDIAPPDGLTAGDFRATTTAPGVFDRSYDPALPPLASPNQQMAAITQLFFLVNWLHDFWYDAGFTEAAGNAQSSNYGRGGAENDALRAEAEDNANNGSRNNANMTTPGDGIPPRMQVFVWDGGDDRSLGISRRKPITGGAAFGLMHTTVTAPVVLANDGAGAPSDACTPLVTPTTDHIVLVDRGTCSFKLKALHVQNAGGVGVIVANNAPSLFPPAMPNDSTITTPINVGVLSVLHSEGVAIKADLAAGPVTATLHRDLQPDLDGALDATVVAHEHGHYLHHRLSECNTQMCRALSEGWADFAALLVMARAGDDFSAAFPVGMYSTQSFPDPVYYGVRRSPYSSNLAINPLSFRHMAAGTPLPPPPFNAGDPAGNAEVHAAGEIWTSMLWQGYAALQQQPDADFEAVRRRMQQYVVAGLLLAPSDATPTETRDALLMAAFAASPADHAVLAAAYARRGFGSCAVSPPRDSLNFQGIVESAEVSGRVVAGAPVLELTATCDGDGRLDGGESARLTVPVGNAGPVALAGVTGTLSSTLPGLQIAEPTVALAEIPPYASRTVSFEVELDDGATTPLAGAFTVALTAGNGCAGEPSAALAVVANADDSPDSSATESFDAARTIWTTAGPDALWTHVRVSALDGEFAAADAPLPSDASLVSPRLTAGAGPLTIQFSHRFSFEGTASVAFDGGVIEYSTDDGASWQDIAALTDPGYNAVLDGDPASTGNPLAGRPAFSGDSPSFPDRDVAQLALGTQLAGQQFQLRFRVGSDVNTGAPGWQIDDIAFQGIVGTPFSTVIADAASCSPSSDAGAPGDAAGSARDAAPPPDVPSDAAPADAGVAPDAMASDAGPLPDAGAPGDRGGCRTSGPGASWLALAAGALAVLVRRRRRWIAEV